MPPGLFERTGRFISDLGGRRGVATMTILSVVGFVALVQRQLKAGLTAGAVAG